MGGGKHVEFFSRFFAEVAGAPSDLSRYHSPSYRALFYEALPETMHRLLVDPSPAAQVRASVTCNMVTEGVLAETGYHGYFYEAFRRKLQPLTGDPARTISLLSAALLWTW